MKQIQRQQLQQKFSPQQIQLMRLLQLPVTDLEQAIKEEVEKNPLLEADIDTAKDEPLPQQETAKSDWDLDDDGDDPYDYDYREHQEYDPNQSRHEYVVNDSLSASERLMQQVSLIGLTDRQQAIANEIIGSLDDAGYLGRDLTLIANDLAFRQGIEATEQEVEEVLHTVQSLDPAGIGARDLQECLLLQLGRMDGCDTARDIVKLHFNDFANHRYEHICESLGITQDEFEAAAATIRRLNPKPGGSTIDDTASATFITPDIILSQHDGQLQFYINDSNLPRLSLNTYYTDMLHDLEQQKGDKTTIQFLRTQQANAQMFIDTLSQRHDTIYRIMRYIVKHQRQYLLTGDPDQLLPLRQREVAQATGLDISTVSRMVNSKFLQTDFGTISLKECFSKGMSTDSGQEVAIETIKQRIADTIASEDKHSPLSDDALTQLLNSQGMPLARRTVAKYREQLGIPVARLRKAIIALVLIAIHAFGASAQMSYYDSIIAVRLAQANKQASTQAPTTVKQSTSTAKNTTRPTSAKERNGKARQHDDATTSPSIDRDLEAYVVPLWYDAFPHNRVNPHGRTRTDIIPDEIILRLAKDSSDFCFPVCNIKTSPYGWRWKRGHHGVDIRLKTGDPVRAAFAGTVRISSRMGGYGNCIVIRHPNGLETLYGHLSKIEVHNGQQVMAGDIIGLGGSTGNSTGPHLHFECRFLYQTFDPEWILDFDNYQLRTKQLHLDKSYFGIHQPQRGERLEYKADNSIIKEPTKKAKKIKRKEYTDKDF